MYAMIRTSLPWTSAITTLLVVVGKAGITRADFLWGAIRWDAFYNSSTMPSDVGVWTARVLTPVVWEDRLPWFAYRQPGGNVTFDGNSPDVMAKEIEFAVNSGIDHWAFDVYPPEIAMSNSLAAYLSSSSPSKNRLSFCLLLQTSWMTQGGLAAWPAKVALYVQHFARPEYRLVLAGRPLIYLFAVDQGAWGNVSTGWQDWAAALLLLRNASVAAGRGAPYVVLQTWNPADGAAQLHAINTAAGSDVVVALSAYAGLGATDAGTPWDTFAAGVGKWLVWASACTRVCICLCARACISVCIL